MERRNLLAGLTVAIVSVFLLTGSAFAAVKTHKQRTRVKPAVEETTTEPGVCKINTLGSFMDMGEFEVASSIADIVEVECQPVYAEKKVTITATELYSRCDKKLYWSKTGTFEPVTGPSIKEVTLDDAGNATVVVFGGPSCAAGESLISAHLETAPFVTVTTGFVVEPPAPTTKELTIAPSSQVEDATTSSVATIAEIEFPPVFAEEPVAVNAAQLYARCHVDPKLQFIAMGPGGPEVVSEEEEANGEGLAETALHLDNDGNAFVVLFGAKSCAAGVSEIEASLVNAPYTTETSSFTILPPETTI